MLNKYCKRNKIFLRFIHLKWRLQREGDIHTYREIFYMPVDSPNCRNGQICAGPKSRTWNSTWVFHLGAEAQILEPSPTAFPRSWSGSGAARIQTGFEFKQNSYQIPELQVVA